MSKTRFFGNLIKTNPTLPTANSSSAYGTATGIWTLEEAGAFRASGDWPVPGSVPGAPTITGVTAGNAQVIVAFNANADAGSFTVSSFTALSSSGESASGSSSPLTVTGLTNGNAVTFTVTATNAAGASSASSASDSATPIAAKGFMIGGNASNVIQTITFSSTGNATDYGDLTTTNTRHPVASGSATRSVVFGGFDGSSHLNTIQYFDNTSSGDASDFGDLTAGNAFGASYSSSTRAWSVGGNSGVKMEYVTISSTGNATDAGDLQASSHYQTSATSSSTRGIIMGGGDNSGSYGTYDHIEYHTITSTGNSSDFGDMTVAHGYHGSGGTSTVAVAAAGRSGSYSNNTNVIEYVTIASTGNGSDFGDLTTGATSDVGACSGGGRMCIFGGYLSNSTVNTIGYITISSAGNTSDFGDLLAANYEIGGNSNSHGGIA